MKRRFLFLLLMLLLLGVATGTAAAQNSYSLWFCKFWTNTDLEGNPAATCSVGVIDYNWGTGRPVPGIPVDHWSGQWTSYVDFAPGTYRITTQNDDGVRVFLGYKHIINDWNKHGTVTNVVTVSLLGGTYSMAVDYFDDVGNAVLKVAWERTGPPQAGAADVTIISSGTSQPPPPASQGSWTSNFWNNTSLSGNPVLTRSENAIDNDWGTGSPAPGVVNSDFFSARWTRAVAFEAGTYRFTTQSDDGIRVSVGGNRIIDNWTQHAVQTNSTEVNLGAGTYDIVVEYFEETGVAVAKFWWEKIGAGTGSPTGVSATTTAYWLNFRSGPGVAFDIITTLPRGTTVPVVGRNSSSTWLQVVYQGVNGWISAHYTTVNGSLSSVPVTG